MKSLSRVRLFVALWTVAYQASPSMEFSRQKYWSGWPFPSPGDLPDPGIKPRSPGLQADALPSEPPGKPPNNIYIYNIKYWWRWGDTGTPAHCWWEYKMVQPLWKIWKFLKIKNRTTIWSSNPTSGYLPKGTEIRILEKCQHSHVHCSIITIAKMWKQPERSLTKAWIRKN